MQWKPRSLILDLFGDYLRYAEGGIRLADITELLAVFGVEPATVRVNLSRLRKEDWFTTSKIGRETSYSLTPHMLDVLNEGRERIFHHRSENWQGRWTMLIYQVPESERAIREQLRKRLAWHGFGQLSPSTWWSPHDRFAEAEELAAECPSAKIDVLWCGSGSPQHDQDLATRCWDLAQLGADYQEFINTFTPLEADAQGTEKEGRTALLERMQIIGAFRRFPFRDPQLPQELQPDGWPSGAAYRLFDSVHQQLGPAATAFVSATIGQALSPPLGSRS